MKKHLLGGCLVASLLLLSGCGSGTTNQTVYVQSVGDILGYDTTATQFSGTVESSKSQKIEKDDDKTIDEIKVQQGDSVKKGQVLFTYNKDSLQISVDSAKLEVESIQNKISSYQQQIAQLKKDKKAAGKSEQLSYNLQIQEAQLDLSSEQYNLKKKQKELDDLQKDLQNADVVAEADGVVQSISSDNSSDNSGAFMTILQTGAYKIKGQVSELEVGELEQDAEVTIHSRIDDNKTWTGTISQVDTNGAVADSDENSMNSDQNTDNTASKYTFYVVPDTQDGMMIGQHVYITVGKQETDKGIWLNADYVVRDGDTAYVWLANTNGVLEKRTVTIGRHNEEANTYEITDGLTLDDYLAFPTDDCKEGEKTTVSQADDSSEDTSGDVGSAAMSVEEGAS
ncbi:efflux RND transporter periplasmic adaptor subunit [Butyricicoccus sp.]|uniref:efflux RND transporter periplasmic adaptor subunit n=1 Tax=Butyricicoccus sp. TaxID=2049021 RepID=UPI003D7D59E6